MAKKVESIKHKADTRAHIPSKEEAGYEEANTRVQDGKKVLELPKNPVVHRGQDPELFWLNKYGNDDRDDLLRADIRSLYRHEHIAPETLIKNLYKVTESQAAPDLFSSVNELFGNALEKDEIEKVSQYYHHHDGWTNRLIQGDSHLVMASLLEREGMAGQVQTIYFDPPYGIKYGGNWQIKLNNREVKDGIDEALTGEPEQIKAFRDTWELGIHSYLSYLRDRLLIAKELLTESGSCFVQISDENVHLVRCVMDEVFGSDNFLSMISFTTSSGFTTATLSRVGDRILWYAKDVVKIKYRQLFLEKGLPVNDPNYRLLKFDDGSERSMTIEERNNPNLIPKNAQIYRIDNISSQGKASQDEPFEYQGTIYRPASNRHWTPGLKGMEPLSKKNRLIRTGNNLAFIRFWEDNPIKQLSDIWLDTSTGGFNEEKQYVVQTNTKTIERCLLMTTDPGDLVLDPTCGSGTTAYVAEQWGRRWITIDTSRIALNIAKQRLMTAVFPYYNLYDEQGSDIRQGFKYKTVPHITLKSLANDEPPATETLYDQPEQDKKLLRVSGPFTVETLQNFEPISPKELDDEVRVNEEEGAFEEVIKQHLISAGIKNGRKDEMVVFRSVELLAGEALHAEGFYMNGVGEKKAYFHIGPKFGTVSKKLVNDAVKECRQKGDASWLVILGFSFESDIEGGTQTTSMGNFEVTKVRIHDDLLQEGLKKKPAKSAASFVTIGEPDIEVVSDEWLVTSKGEKLCNYGIFKKLSGLDSLAKINGLSETNLRAYSLFSQRRDVWLNLPNEKSSNFDFSEYSRRAGEKFNWGVQTVFGNSERFFGGVGDFDYFISELGLTDPTKFRALIESFSRDKQNAQWLTEIPEVKQLATHHYALITIKGLDIYDPIKDEVKPRNVHDIAYWMVDDDYDGSNFIVKQVFFCGGDKDEFNKWKKGLDNLAKDSTKKKVEKTLKIEIDDEAFDRLYGHISHPIEIKSRSQKIAVRIVSQFGEECTKVMGV